jgi:hypothetical protein
LAHHQKWPRTITFDRSHLISVYQTVFALKFRIDIRGEPEDHGPGAVEIEVYCADLRPGDDSTRQAFDLWLDLLRHGKAAPFEPARLVCRKRYAV